MPAMYLVTCWSLAALTRVRFEEELVSLDLWISPRSSPHTSSYDAVLLLPTTFTLIIFILLFIDYFDIKSTHLSI